MGNTPGDPTVNSNRRAKLAHKWHNHQQTPSLPLSSNQQLVRTLNTAPVGISDFSMLAQISNIPSLETKEEAVKEGKKGRIQYIEQI